jgi:threonine synthase
LAFKDFGARFMAELMGYFNRGESRELVILVATSGDTGGAVAAGFHRTPGIQVIILYPSGKVSALQEKQLTTLGDNIHALEIEGVFDDCQAMVKQAFLDADLSRQLRLSSANSINIARLVPQSFYYFEAYKQLLGPLVFSVPSGNFGNLTGGLIAKRMGLPIAQLIAATNINDVVPVYLREGIFQARASVPTISNAMDVGNPSNFARLEALFASPDCSTWNVMREFIQGYSFTDQQTKTAIKATYELYQYTLDPHGAVGLLALNAYLDTHPEAVGVFLETAHPAKFPEEVEAAIGRKIRLPPTLNALRHKEKSATLLPATYEALRGFLLDKFG